jgi:N-methylhydantoinase A
LEDAVTGRRSVYFGEALGWADSTVYRRDRIPIGATIQGPAIVEEMSATTVMLPGQQANVDPLGNIIIEMDL